jgi:chemotaxis response regulator CheB
MIFRFFYTRAHKPDIVAMDNNMTYVNGINEEKKLNHFHDAGIITKNDLQQYQLSIILSILFYCMNI